MGTDKNIKLHIVTDIKGLDQKEALVAQLLSTGYCHALINKSVTS